VIAKLIQGYAEDGKCATRREVYAKQVRRLRGVDVFLII
jgi:CRISPR/Cas system-associated exonuclease Cas4 (RecB family)